MTIDVGHIERALSPLIGLPLRDVGRAATLLWLELGERVHAPTDRRPDYIVNEYALHVQCAWRVSSETAVVVESRDLYESADLDQSRSTVDAARGAAADVRLATWIAGFAVRGLVVRNIAVDRTGGFRLALSDGFAVDAITEPSGERGHDREQWRLLQPGSDSGHFVV